MRESIHCVYVCRVRVGLYRCRSVCGMCVRPYRCCVSLSACTACVQREVRLPVSVRAYTFAAAATAAGAVGWWLEIAFWLLFLFLLLPLPMQQLNRMAVSVANNIKITLQSITCTYYCSKVLVHAWLCTLSTGTRWLRPRKPHSQAFSHSNSNWCIAVDL